MNFTLFTGLFARIDAATALFVSDYTGRVIAQIMPVVSAGLALWVMLYAYLIARQMADEVFHDFFYRAVRASLIIAIAGQGGFYQSQIVEMIRVTPDWFAAALTGGTAGAAASIDQMVGIGFQKAQAAFDMAGTFSMDMLAYWSFGVVIIGCTAFLAGIGGAYIILAKIGLALLAALGPIFILALLFKATSGMFERWISAVLGYTFQVVFVSAIFGLMIALFETYMSQVNFDSGMSFAGMMGGCVVLCVVFLFVLIQLPQAAVALGGGIAVDLWHSSHIASRMGSQAASAGSAAARGVTAAASSGAFNGRGGALPTASGKFKGSRAA